MKDCISAGKSILQGAIGVNNNGPIIDDDFQKYVLDSFHSDEIIRSVKCDYLLLMLGKAQLSKLGFRRPSQVREKLRIMGRLKLQLRSLSGNESASVEDFITPSQFDVCITAVKSLAMESDRNSLSGANTVNKPSLALKAGQLLKKVADLKKGEAILKKEKLLGRKILKLKKLPQSLWIFIEMILQMPYLELHISPSRRENLIRRKSFQLHQILLN